MERIIKTLEQGGVLISSQGRFPAKCQLHWPIADPQNDSIQDAPLESITGTVVPKDGTPTEIFKETNLVFEIFAGLKFEFSFATPSACDIRIKHWVD